MFSGQVDDKSSLMPINSKIVLIGTTGTTDGSAEDRVEAALESAVDGDVVEKPAPAPVPLRAEAEDMVVLKLAALVVWLAEDMTPHMGVEFVKLL